MGTVQPSQNHIPKELKLARLEKGMTEFYMAPDRNVLSVNYRAAKDKPTRKTNEVYLLTTDHGDKKTSLRAGLLQINGRY